ENTAVGGGSMTSSWGLICTPSVLTASHTTRKSTRSHRCSSRLASRRQAGRGGGVSVPASAESSCAARDDAARAPGAPLAVWLTPTSWPIRLSHERPRLLELTRLRERRRAFEQIGRVRLVRQIANSAPVLRQERRTLGHVPPEPVERGLHVRGPSHVLPVGNGDLALGRSGLVRPLADAALFFRPHTLGILERIVDGRLRPEEVEVRHSLDE